MRTILGRAWPSASLPARLRRARRIAHRAIPLFGAIVLVPLTVSAQGAAITGTVRDAVGAVLPGVTIQATSDALIEKVRTTVTDGMGQYAIVDLRPGTYAVTFKLPGFRTAARERVELTGSFVATLNVELQVGPVVDTVIVTPSGTAPIDVHSTTQRAAMTSEIVASIPTGRSLANLAVLIPGMITVSARNQYDVGGTNNLQNIFTAIHGGRVTDQRIYIDGINLRNLQSEGHATNFTPDIGATREVTIDYSASTAEEPLGGVRASYIPRDGGNTFQLTTFATAADARFQGRNVPRAQRAPGVAQPEVLKLTYDINPTVGGPLTRDRLWFYAAARTQTNQNYIGGIFENLNAGDPTKWTYAPDMAHPALFSIAQQNASGRITWQATPKHQIAAFIGKEWRTWDEGDVNRSPEAFSRFRFGDNQVAIVSWSSPLSTRLLAEARGAYHAESWLNVGADELLPNNRTLIPVLEQGGAYPGLMYRAKNNTYTGNSAPFIGIAHASLSYVTGTHAARAGFDLLSGTNTNPNTFNQTGFQYRVNSGVPNQITEFATPYELRWRLTELGAFAQDRWTLNRVTLNAGLRVDGFATSFPQQHLGPGPLVPTRDITFSETTWYRLKDLSPRFGAAWDVTGRATTVVKATAGRYLVALPPGTGNPAANLSLSVTRRWDDSDVDFVPDCDILNPLANGECGIVSDLNFGSARPSVTYDPAVLRGWNVRPVDWEFSTGIQHALVRGVDVGASYFRRVYGNFTVQDNRATQASDYTSFEVPAPRDPRLSGGGGYPVAGLYDLNPDKRGQVDNYVTSADRYGRWMEHWNGMDLNVNVRLPDVTVHGGVSTGRTSMDVCEVAAQLPEILGTATGALGTRPVPASLAQCHADTRLLTQTKWMASYSVPAIDVDIAAAFQSTPGVELQANYVAPDAVIQPSLGRPLSGGVNSTVTLLAPGSRYGERLNQLDLRASKPLRTGKMRIAVNLDVYNVFNASPVTAANVNYVGDGSRWLQPQAILAPRLFKISAQFDY